MITKERLEELIKEEATIYLCTLSDVKEMTYNTIPIFLKRNWEDYEDRMFETKEEAEWYLEFGNITRTETLKLPTWKEAKDGIEYQFYASKGNIYLLSTKIKVGYSVDKENPYIIRVERIGYSNSEQDFEFTKENYIDACRLCKKLFLGE